MKQTKKAAKTKTAATTDVSEQKHRGKTLTGRAPKGISFDPAEVEILAMGADLQYNRPRPATTRYPVDLETFNELKEEAQSIEFKATAKRASTIVTDKTKKPAEAAEAKGIIEAVGAPLSGAPAAAAPSTLTSFAGISDTGWFPPDCTLAVGPNHVLVSVNATVAIYAKTGGAAVITRTLTSWFSTVIANAKIFDPKALYDQHAGRWVLLAVALGPGATESYFLLSISKTADPTGPWWNYKIDATKDGTTATNNWADYPSLGVDSQALYLTANMFRFDGAFSYAKVRVVPKVGPYSGGILVFTDFVKLKNADGSMAFTVQPCHTFGAPGTEYLVNSVYPSNTGIQNKLSIWLLNNPTTAPTLILKTITVSPYALPPDAVQKGGGTPLDSGDVRVLNAVFRGGSVWCAFTTAHDYGAGNVAAIQWFQINAAAASLIQQGIYGAQGFHYFYPAVMPDSNGNMTMVFCRSGSTQFASILYTGRKATDPLGDLQPSALLKAGTANYVQLDSLGRNRWGDYAGVGSDPADTLKVWFYSGYTVAGNSWATHIGASKF
ncbi:MAG: hypothetical protein ICV81_05095 [Flavisolibacter sp.]|nr:hypothetical protein [Flavisolibacter sp.]